MQLTRESSHNAGWAPKSAPATPADEQVLERRSAVRPRPPDDDVLHVGDDRLYCVALYSFCGEQPGDLSFQKGERIEILNHDGDWWEGRLGNIVGLFPRNHVALTTPNV